MDVRHNNNAPKELNDCIGSLLHIGLNVITFRTLLHLGPNVITFRTLLHLGQLLHLGLQHACCFLCRLRVNKRADLFKTNLTLVVPDVFYAGPRFRSSFQTSPDENSLCSIFHHSNLLVTPIRFWLLSDANLTEKNFKTVLINLCSKNKCS